MMASEVNDYARENYLRLAYVLDSNYNIKYVLDTFTDILWVERYCGHGEFEINMPANSKILENCHLNDYITIVESDVVMIIDTIGIHTDAESGDTIRISGKTLTSILEYRVILDESIGEVHDDGTSSKIGIQDAIRTIITNNFISPSNSKRRIPKFSYKESGDKRITTPVIEAFEPKGENAYDRVYGILRDNKIGFRMHAVESGGFQFELYCGTDRTWDQNEVPAVVFSASYENLPNSDYLNTETGLKNIAYVSWDWNYTVIVEDWHAGQEYPTIRKEYISGSSVNEVNRGSEPEGLARRELYIRDDTQYQASTIHMSQPANLEGIRQQAISKAQQKLAEYESATKIFEGETEPFRQFVYGKDYFLGDIVQLANAYGQSGKCRITEIARSRDTSGVVMTPTFESVD